MEVSVLRGSPTAAEIAAVVTVLAARSVLNRRSELATASAPGAASRSEWSNRSPLLRSALVAGPGAWRASSLPR